MIANKFLQPSKTDAKCSSNTVTVSSTRDPVHQSVTTDHSPTDNVPVTDNQCYGSVIFGSSVQKHAKFLVLSETLHY